MATLRQLDAQTIQEHEPKDSIGYSIYWLDGNGDGLLGPWGSHSRDRQLRNAYRNQYSWLAQSAVGAIVRKVIQTPWVIEAGRNTATYFQRLLQDAHFQEGWGQFLSRVLLDYLTCDYGAYIEIIGRGAADTPLRGRVMGIAHLDSLRCVPTGNLEYPVVYYSRRSGKLHRLHHTRVIRLVDMPDGDESRHMAGLSALSRSIAFIEQQIPMMQYVAGMMANRPPAGIGMTPFSDAQWKAAYDDYNRRTQQSGKSGIMWLHNPSPDAEIKFTRFAEAPEGFAYTDYIDVAVNAFAAAFGIDRQDIFPLAGKMAGTATQSVVLYEKSQGMMYGHILTMLERMINIAVLPPAAEFSFERQDEEKAAQTADRDRKVLDNANVLLTLGASQAQVMKYIADNSEGLRDALTNDAGEIELPDDDVQPATDDTAIAADTNSETPSDAAIVDDTDSDATSSANKAIQATRLEFEDTFDDIQKEIRAGNLNRRRAGILLRGALSRAINKAYEDGLQAGGVDPAEATDEDRAWVKSFIAEASKYVSNYTDVLINGDGISDAQAKQRAAMWFNKSVSPAFDTGLWSADKNGMYEFVLGATEKHCGSCATLNGQAHRLKLFLDSGWFPRSSQLQCKGFRCDCRLIKTTKRANGRLSRVKVHCDVHNHEHEVN